MPTKAKGHCFPKIKGYW